MPGGLFSACEISHSHRDCLFSLFFWFLQHGASAKAYDMYIGLLNERHKGKCLLVLTCGLLSSSSWLVHEYLFHGSDDWRRGTDLS